jgi:hypothetical protein
MVDPGLIMRRRLTASVQRKRLEQCRIVQDLGDQVFGARLAVHVSDQVRELLARFEQLVQRVDLARNGRGREVVHAFERDVDGHVALAGQRVWHAERDARLHRLHALVEVVDVDSSGTCARRPWQRFLRIAAEIAMTPMTNGTWTFFCAPYSSTSYSICTRGARLRPMNF